MRIIKLDKQLAFMSLDEFHNEERLNYISELYKLLETE